MKSSKLASVNWNHRLASRRKAELDTSKIVIENKGGQHQGDADKGKAEDPMESVRRALQQDQQKK